MQVISMHMLGLGYDSPIDHVDDNADAVYSFVSWEALQIKVTTQLSKPEPRYVSHCSCQSRGKEIPDSLHYLTVQNQRLPYFQWALSDWRVLVQSQGPNQGQIMTKETCHSCTHRWEFRPELDQVQARCYAMATQGRTRQLLMLARCCCPNLNLVDAH